MAFTWFRQSSPQTAIIFFHLFRVHFIFSSKKTGCFPPGISTCSQIFSWPHGIPRLPWSPCQEEKVSFGWYLKAIGPAALIGYFFGVAGMMGQQAAGLAAWSWSNGGGNWWWPSKMVAGTDVTAKNMGILGDFLGDVLGVRDRYCDIDGKIPVGWWVNISWGYDIMNGIE